MIGSLLYHTASRPDISFSVGMCAWFQSNPKEIHHQATKMIFKYLEYTQHLGLWYSKSFSFELVAYSDSDFGGCRLGRRSTSGTCHFLGENLVSWSSRKQNSVALSSTEAEYITAGSCYAQSLWIKYQLKDYGIKLNNMPIMCDNKSAICLSKNSVLHSRTKHIDIRYHFIKEHVLNGNIVLDYICTEEQLADIFTKPLVEERFSYLRRELGIF